MKYILLDTCTIVDCAYSRVEKAAPSLLVKVLEACNKDGVKLLVPEVVLFELDKASEQASSNTLKGLKVVEDEVNEISRGGILGGRHLKDLQNALKTAKRGIKEDARTSLEQVRTIANDPTRAEQIEITETDVLEAIKIAIAQQKPAKAKGDWGLVQGDCLIVAGLSRFMTSHPDDEFVLCSSNTADFGQKDEGAVSLHADIAARLENVAYYTNPIDMLKDEITGIDDAEKKEMEELGESFERVSSGARLDRYPGVVGGMQALQNAMALQSLGINYDAVTSDMSDTMARVAGIVDPVSTRKVEELIASTGALARIASKDLQDIQSAAVGGAAARMAAYMAKRDPQYLEVPR